MNLCFKTNITDEKGEGLAHISRATKDLRAKETAFEEEKRQFKGFMEKEKELIRVERDKLKRSQWKFEAEVHISKDKALFERERSVRNKEDKLELANLIALKKEEKQREFQATGDARLASEQNKMSKARKAHAERFQKENEILTVRECDQRQKGVELKKEMAIFSKEKDDIRDQNQSLFAREQLVHRIEVSVRADMTDMFKREIAVQKGKFAVEKRENAVEKSLAKENEKEKKMTEERVGLEKANYQAKLACGSMFELWQEKKDLGFSPK